MATARSQMQGPALSTSNSSPVDEESPLLSKHSANGYKNRCLQTAATEATDNGELSKSKILRIMSSVWIGTFVAGLGEHYLVLSQAGHI